MTREITSAKENNIFRKLQMEGLDTEPDPVKRLLFREYGAIFAARGSAVPPSTIVFRDEGEVSKFQRSISTRTASVGDHELTLQRSAMDALLDAVWEAIGQGLSITPRGKDSAARTYADTVELWASRVEPALDHWAHLGRVTPDLAAHIRSLSPYEQVAEVLQLEAEGIYFAKDLSKSIIYSVAPPGASQHLSLLAFDVSEFNDPRVRRILACHGWFQTVTSDLPHFTYLGVSEDELPALGLKKTTSSEREFWVPDI